MVEAVIVSVPALKMPPPPRSSRVVPLMVQPSIVTVPSCRCRRRLIGVAAELPLMVEALIVSVPKL